MDDDTEDRRGFRVTDRRRFADSGEARPETREERAPGEPAASPTAPPGAEPRPDRSLPDEPVTFSTFVLGLSTQVLLHLGEIPNPLTHKVELDLGAAKQVID